MIFNGTKELETERLLLRKIQPDDYVVAKQVPTVRRMALPYLESSFIPSTTVNHSAMDDRIPVNPCQNRIM